MWRQGCSRPKSVEGGTLVALGPEYLLVTFTDNGVKHEFLLTAKVETS
jgi:hypothetical protein